MKIRAIHTCLLLAACGSQQKSPEVAITPDPQPPPVTVLDDTIRPGSRVAIQLDEAVGPQFSHEGQRVTASVIPTTSDRGDVVFPAGTKLILQVTRLQPGMAGTMGLVSLLPRAVSYRGESFPVDGRIVGVSQGEIVPQGSLTPADLERDLLGKTAVISVGASPPQQQLPPGTAMSVELRGPLPLAFWSEGDRRKLDLGWVRDILAIFDEKDDRELVGKRIVLFDVAVESVIGDVVFWVGPSKNQRLLVVMDQFLDEPETRTVVRADDRVDLEGTIELMPPRSVAPLLWNMVSEKEAASLTPHPVYVHATKVVHASPQPKAKR